MEAIVIGMLLIWNIVLTVLVGVLFIESRCISKIEENNLKNQHHFTFYNSAQDETSLADRLEQAVEKVYLQDNSLR